MDHGLTPVSGVQSTAGFSRGQRLQPRLTAADSSPPPALQAEYSAAAQAIETLASQQINLHFEVDKEDTVHVQVLDSDGQVIKEIPASSLFDTLSGGGLLIDQLG
jgi:hypothetical protein